MSLQTQSDGVVNTQEAEQKKQILEVTVSMQNFYEDDTDEHGFAYLHHTAESQLKEVLVDELPDYLTEALLEQKVVYDLPIQTQSQLQSGLNRMKEKLFEITSCVEECEEMDLDEVKRNPRSIHDLPKPVESHLTLTVLCDQRIPLTDDLLDVVKKSIERNLDHVTGVEVEVKPGAAQLALQPQIDQFVQQAIDVTAGIEPHQMRMALKKLHHDMSMPFDFERFNEIGDHQLQNDRENTLLKATKIEVAEAAFEKAIPGLCGIEEPTLNAKPVVASQPETVQRQPTLADKVAGSLRPSLRRR